MPSFMFYVIVGVVGIRALARALQNWLAAKFEIYIQIHTELIGITQLIDSQTRTSSSQYIATVHAMPSRGQGKEPEVKHHT